jgi:hyperosmotically inducible periplasmic protein
VEARFLRDWNGPYLGKTHNMKEFVRLALALTIALGACSGQDQKQAQDSARQLASAAPAVAQNAVVIGSVSAKLATVDVDAVTTVHIAANDGVVTLSGQARSAQERDRYVAAARSVGSVTSIVDELTVNPHLQGIRQQASDAVLATRVGAAIAAQAGINVFSVTPSVRAGIVTLSGVVPSPSIARTIAQSARSVPGVRSVVNEMSVEPAVAK